jgi:ubiquinone/menaquinone biosynthesis C-methylase UbiE
MTTRTDAPKRKPYLGVQMEGPIARWYDRSTRGRIPELTRTAAAVAAWLPAGSQVLEVAPGPGFLAIELAKHRYVVTGIDISKSFVEIAGRNARDAGVTIDFRRGDVARMPFADDSFDYVVCVAAFKNFADPVAALDEVHRVLRPGGRASIQDLRKEATDREIAAEVRAMKQGAVNSLITRWIFRTALLRAAYTAEAVGRLAARSHFGGGDLTTNGVGFDLRLIKTLRAPARHGSR